MAQQPVNPNRVSGRINPGGRYGYRKHYRQKSAQELAEKRAQRTPQQQLEELDRRLGPGVGAVRERARLQAQIDDTKNEEA